MNSGPGIAILESKFLPPSARPGIIPRTALVDRILKHDAEQVVTLIAPPGYGKTTVLAQWARRRGHKVAWVTVNKDDNDPSVLLADIAAALARVPLLDPEAVDSVTAGGSSISTALGRLTPSLMATSQPITLVFDQVEAVDNPEARDVFSQLALRLPPGFRLALATRTQPPLPLPLLRSHRDVVEVGVNELAMDRQEAQLLLRGVGAEFSDDEVEALVDQTEGWPVGLYLAALASRRRGHAVASSVAFRGDDRLMRDYLRSEILSRIDPSTVEFLTRTSVLDHLSGPLCDAVLDANGSQAVLETLEASNLLLVPLDRHREQYRYHNLFRDLLAAELRRNEPELVPLLHARAAQWFEASHLPGAAIGHAQEAGDPDRVARLVTVATVPAYSAGHATTVRRWFEWFRAEGLVDRYPEVAVLGGVIESVLGQSASAERWTVAAEAGTFDRTLPDGGTTDGMLAYLRALACRDGVQRMRADARMAQAALAPGNVLRAAALLLEGMSYLLDGDPEAADPILSHACDVGLYLGATADAAVAMAERAVVAIGRHDWDEAEAFAARGLAIVAEHRLDDYLEAAVVYAVAARSSIHRGDRRAATEYVARAARLRPLLTYAVPGTAQIQLQIARAYLELADPSGVRTVLREVSDILRQRPNLGVLTSERDEIQTALDAIRAGHVGTSSLSVAELRLLPYLSTHLTFQEIGERLHVSRHTVKTQAISVYRKVGASSRSEAVERVHEAGLLGV
jgi:LuxR family maltose regulon positive regulatory protein